MAGSPSDVMDQQPLLAAKRPRRSRTAAADSNLHDNSAARDVNSSDDQAAGCRSGSAAAGDLEPPCNDDGLTEYERQREQVIARNRQRLAELKIPELVAQMLPPPKPPRAPASQRGIGGRSARAALAAALPRRQSPRLQGIAPDATLAGGVASEGRDGSITLAAGPGSRNAAGAAAAPKTRHPEGTVPFRSLNTSDTSDAAFLELLRSCGGGSCPAEHNGARSGAAGAELARLQLRADDVAKVTREGVTALAFHPTAPRLVLAAGDKSGKVSLWDMDRPGVADEQADASGGVHMFEPHGEYVSALKWLADGRLATAAYDGTLRLLDPGSGVFELLGLAGAPDGVEWSAMDAAADGRAAFLATPEGGMCVVDPRVGSLVQPLFQAHTRKVNTLQLRPGEERQLVSSCTDGACCIWDVRQLGAPAVAASGVGAARGAPKRPSPACEVRHSKSSQAAAWAPDGSARLLTISFDDTLRVWGPAGGGGGGGSALRLVQQLQVKHNTQTGRWITPFRPAWSPAGDALLVGDMRRAVAIYDAASGAQAGQLASELMTAIPSRLALHPAGLPLVAAATSSGRVHVYR